MKFMLASDSPSSPTGMAGQMRYIARHLIKKSHEVDYFGWQNVIHDRFNDRGIEYDVYPAIGNPSDNTEIFGRKRYPIFFEKLKPDVLITLGDAWMVNQIPSYKFSPLWIMYFPIDGHPLNDDIRRTVSSAHVPVAMSKFGKMVCANEGIDVNYIPHQIDYKRLSRYSSNSIKKKARKKYFPEVGDNTVLYASIARNNPRKHHMRLLRAFEIFVRENNLTPDDVRLYLHLDPKDVMVHTRLNSHDYFFIEWVNTLGLDRYIIYPENMSFSTGVSEEELYERMSAMDVHVNATGGEGFGVPTLEVMAMGKPNVITNYTTSEELIMHKSINSYDHVDGFSEARGTLVPYEKLYMERPKVFKAWVDVNAMADAFYLYYDDIKLRKLHGDNALKWSSQYDSKNVNRMWDELIDSIPQVGVLFK